jgi:hypothetical protein
MQMGSDGVAGVANESEDLATFYAVVGVDLDGAGLHVGIERVVPMTEIEDDVIAVGGVE